MIWNWDDKLKNHLFELTESVDTIVLGQKMTDRFISYWLNITMTKPDDPFYKFSKKMIEAPKAVFTKKLKNLQWVNTALATGNLTRQGYQGCHV